MMAHNGERIGFVTSCAIDGDRFITSQAYLDFAYTALDTPIFIHQGGVLRRAQGDMMDRPATSAKVVARFPKL